MNFHKTAPIVFLTLVMGSACIYASSPYVMPLVERFTKATVKEQSKVVDKITKPVYPVGTFEHEQKRTI